MGEATMKFILGWIAILALSACGVETASTAATSAALKKQELEQGKKTMEQMQQKLDQANLQVQQRAEQAGGDK
jgi:outer membrane lipopolysaccharide assembly protein LptE/RlpB